MKKLLPIALLLVSGTALAQTGGNGRGCRVLIGQDWVAMGATSIPSCLKYAEAAASPGERQFAEFGSTELAYQDGQYFQSTDGGANWQRFYPQQGGGVISSLNVLRVGPAAPAEAAPKVEKPKNAEPAATPAEVVVAPVPVVAPPVAKPSKMQPTSPAPAPAPSPSPSPSGNPESALAADTAAAANEFPAASVAATVVPPTAALAAGASRAQQEYATTEGSSGPRGCQIHVLQKWQVTPTSSLADCGRLLAGATTKSGAKSGQAYWAGNYLFFSGNQLYRSADGQDWRAVK